jgi:hypothetical protein
MVPAATLSVQSVPQLMPLGADVTVPEPLPALVTVSTNCSKSNRAEAVTLPVPAGMVQLVVVPEHAPDHSTNCEFVPADAVSAIEVVALNEALHVLPQVMPAGDEVTVPVPVPVLDTATDLTTG